MRICACADLVDLTGALDGHEAYTDTSAYAEPASGEPQPDSVRPNDEGAALMADPLAKYLASLLGIRPPKASDGTVTMPENIAVRSGEPDVDGDLVPDARDEAPEDPANHRRKHDRHGSDRDSGGHHHGRSPKRADVQPIADRPAGPGSTADSGLSGARAALAAEVRLVTPEDLDAANRAALRRRRCSSGGALGR